MFARTILAMTLLLCAAPVAATVTLDLQLNTAAHTWEVFASVGSDNRGLASFALDVTGAGGASVTGSTMAAPRVFDAGLNDFTGFNLNRSNGTNGVEVRASQDTVSGNAALLIMDLGVAAPVKIASGTYTGDAGTLTAALHPGFLFNVFPTNYVVGGPTEAAGQVIPDVAAVPEPAAVGMISVALLASLTRRKAQRGIRAL